MARISDVVTCTQSNSNYMENIPTLLSNENVAVQVCDWCHHELCLWTKVICCSSKRSTVYTPLAVEAFVIQTGNQQLEYALFL